MKRRSKGERTGDEKAKTGREEVKKETEEEKRGK